jgi:hypothetical protein
MARLSDVCWIQTDTRSLILLNGPDGIFGRFNPHSNAGQNSRSARILQLGTDSRTWSFIAPCEQSLYSPLGSHTKSMAMCGVAGENAVDSARCAASL